MLADDHHRGHPTRRHGKAHGASERAGAGEHPAGDGKRPDEAGSARSRKDLEQKVGELTAEVERLGRDLEEARDKYVRVLADFDNYRKRVARESQERTRCANEELITRLLGVVDNFERAFQASEGSPDAQGLRKGLELTYAQMRDLLAREGLCPIECLGEKFDPSYHEAIMALEKEGAEGDKVIEEVQRGYTLGGKVIRPSKVVVSK